MANNTWEEIQKEIHAGLEIFEKQMEEAKRKNAAAYEYYSAVQFAKRSVNQEELMPYSKDEYGKPEYTVQQGLKAACLGREDIAATLIIQQAILGRLNHLRTLLWICIAILAYIAVRLS